MSHVFLDDPEGGGFLKSIEDDGKQIPENIAAYYKPCWVSWARRSEAA